MPNHSHRFLVHQLTISKIFTATVFSRTINLSIERTHIYQWIFIWHIYNFSKLYKLLNLIALLVAMIEEHKNVMIAIHMGLGKYFVQSLRWVMSGKIWSLVTYNVKSTV